MTAREQLSAHRASCSWCRLGRDRILCPAYVALREAARREEWGPPDEPEDRDPEIGDGPL